MNKGYGTASNEVVLLVVFFAYNNRHIAIANVLGELITSYYTDEDKKRAAILELQQHALTEERILYYGYCHVYEVDGEVAGVISTYRGELEDALMAHLRATTSKCGKEPASEQHDEHEAAHNIVPRGYSLSVVSVLPKCQRQKIGQQLIHHIEQVAKNAGYPCVSVKGGRI